MAVRRSATEAATCKHCSGSRRLTCSQGGQGGQGGQHGQGEQGGGQHVVKLINMVKVVKVVKVRMVAMAMMVKRNKMVQVANILSRPSWALAHYGQKGQSGHWST